MTDGNKRKLLFLFRSPTEGNVDPYNQALEAEGYHPVSVPVIKFNVVNTEEYTTRLSNYKEYSSIVFTSQLAVSVTNHIITAWPENNRDELVKNLLCYVVGKATAKAAKALGFLPHGEDSGNAENLSDILVSERPDAEIRPVLFPCSSIRKDTLPDKLHTNGIKVEEIHVYETVHRNDLLEEVNQLIIKNGEPVVAVFFSPSGVQAFKENKLNDLFARSKMVAIGPTTRAEMEKEGIPVFGTCFKPEPLSLVEVLKCL